MPIRRSCSIRTDVIKAQLCHVVVRDPLVYFPPRFCSRNNTFFRTVDISNCAELLLGCVPMGSYFKKLSGRAVRARLKVL
jgi:hypothetical protein